MKDFNQFYSISKALEKCKFPNMVEELIDGVYGMATKSGVDSWYCICSNCTAMSVSACKIVILVSGTV